MKVQKLEKKKTTEGHSARRIHQPGGRISRLCARRRKSMEKKSFLFLYLFVLCILNLFLLLFFFLFLRLERSWIEKRKNRERSNNYHFFNFTMTRLKDDFSFLILISTLNSPPQSFQSIILLPYPFLRPFTASHVYRQPCSDPSLWLVEVMIKSKRKRRARENRSPR